MSYSSVKSCIVVLFSVAVIPVFSIQAGALTWDECRQKVLTDSPVIKAADMQEKAAEARALLAGGLKPSKVAVELENFGASGELKAEDPLETTFSVSQELEISGKRGAGIKAGKSAARAAAMEREFIVRRTVAEARKVFFAIVAAKERKHLADESVKLAGSILDMMQKKAGAGKVPPLEVERSETEYAISLVELDKVDRQIRAMQDRLAVFCGVTGGSVLDVDGKMSDLSSTAGKSEMADQKIQEIVSGHPEFLKSEAICGQKQAELSVVRAQYIPSLELSGGVRQYEASGDSAYVASLGLNIPLFSRNGRAVDAAKSESLSAELSRDSVRISLANQFRTLVLDMESSRKQIVVLQGKAIPSAERAYAAADEGYKQGKFGYLDVLDARKALLNSRARYIDARLEHEVLLSEMEVFGRGSVN